MYSNTTFHSEESLCEIYISWAGTHDHINKEAYILLVFIAAMNIITFPITTLLNSLVIIAVKTKPRLKRMSNIALACLATTDGTMGVIGQPFLIVWTTAGILQEEITSAYCFVARLGKHVMRVLALASVLHLALLNVERYIAIKCSLQYLNMVTETRILCSSALMWLLALLLTVSSILSHDMIFLTLSNITLSLCLLVIIYSQVLLYFETRRQEKAIAAHQVSVEARQKFLKDRKAFKLTSTVLVLLVLTYSPTFVVRKFLPNSITDSGNKYVTFHLAYATTTFLVVLNSLINPIIYCVRIREFRLAFIELVFKKRNTEAENF